MMIQASDELVRIDDSYKQQIEDAGDYLRRLQGERQKLLNDEAIRLAGFRVGQRVRTKKQQYEITKITGYLFTISGISPHLSIEYTGRQVLASGALGARQKKIFEFEAVEGAQMPEKVSEAVSEAENGSEQVGNQRKQGNKENG